MRKSFNRGGKFSIVFLMKGELIEKYKIGFDFFNYIEKKYHNTDTVVLSPAYCITI